MRALQRAVGARVAPGRPLGDRATRRLPSLRLAAPRGTNRPARQGPELRVPQDPSGPPSPPSASERSARRCGLHLSLFCESGRHGFQRRRRAGKTPGGSELSAASPIPGEAGARRARSPALPRCALGLPASRCPAGAARPLLVLGREHVRGERAEVTVTAGRREGAAAPWTCPAWSRPDTSPALKAPSAPPGTPGRSPAQARACPLWRPSLLRSP